MSRKQDTRISRRKWLKTTGSVAGAAIGWPYILHSGTLAATASTSANKRLTVAVIGVGGMGTVHLKNLLEFRREGKVNIAAVCDADEKRLAKAVETAGPGATPYRDYRHILERKDIDAVVIATPDHWHAVQSVHACECGKHVYVEKPASVTIAEGKAMVAAARRYKRAVQVGAQARTAKGAHATCIAIRNGIVGKVTKVTCWHYETPIDENPVPDCDPPPELDWDLWLGPLRWRPYNPRYCPGTFRWMMESGGGQIRDRGAHQFSTILWCMNTDDQTSFTVEATGTPPTKGLWDCPVTMDVTYTFKNPDWQLIWAQPGEKVGKSEFGNVFWGEKGRLILEWEGAYKDAEPEAVNFKVPPGGVVPPRTDEYDDFNMNHKADWFKAIHESTRPAVDIEIGHRVATLCNLGNLSYLLGRKLVWDGDRQEVIGDEQANRLLGKPQRYPYHL
jgi:predicted dehydrogenase